MREFLEDWVELQKGGFHVRKDAKCLDLLLAHAGCRNSWRRLDSE